VDPMILSGGADAWLWFIALRDAVRGIGMFQRMEVPVLGMVRNMAYFACPHFLVDCELHVAGSWR
jgi:Mrp family chromosome partitioning ATPase